MGLRAWINRWATRVLERERDRLRQEVDWLRAEVQARGGLQKPMADPECPNLVRSDSLPKN